MRGYCYIFYLREFIKTDENVFKIGRTEQDGDKRLKQYPKGSIEKIKICVTDCRACEKQIIKQFNKKFINRSDYGREYYEGDYKNMLKEFLDITSRFSVADTYVPSISIIKKSKSKSKSKSKYICEICVYETNKKHNLYLHEQSKRHIKLVSLRDSKLTNPDLFVKRNTLEDFLENRIEQPPAAQSVTNDTNLHQCQTCKKILSNGSNLKRHIKYFCGNKLTTNVKSNNDARFEQIINKLSSLEQIIKIIYK